MSESCINCPSPTWDGSEFYQFIVGTFDVRKARKIVADGREVSGELTRENLKALMLPVDSPDDTWKVDESGRKYKTLQVGVAVNEKHLTHIPEEKLSEPVILIPFRIWSRRDKKDAVSHVLIDGSHRAVRLCREGKPVMAYVLTEKEALSVCTNREPNWWKGLRKAKPKTSEKEKV